MPASSSLFPVRLCLTRHALGCPGLTWYTVCGHKRVVEKRDGVLDKPHKPHNVDPNLNQAKWRVEAQNRGGGGAIGTRYMAYTTLADSRTALARTPVWESLEN